MATSLLYSWLQRVPANYRPSYAAKTRSKFYAIISFCFALPFFGILLLSLWEWLSIGVFAFPDKIAEYHFGSAAMIGEGGSHYASAAAYAHYALRQALFPLLPLVTLLVVAAIRNNIFYQALAWSFMLLTVLIGLLTFLLTS